MKKENLNLLDNIAKKYGTDKSSDVHNYCNKYEKYLQFQTDENLNLLEIGILDGRSLKMWNEFYPNAKIVGIDINPKCKQYEGGRVQVEIGSQTDIQFLNEVIEKYSNFDIVIDDGSHVQSNMIASFETLFSSLRSGGIYIIEDVCCAYWAEFEGGYKKPTTVVEYFKNLIDHVNFGGLHSSKEPYVARREDQLIEDVNRLGLDIRIDIESINFMNSIIIITKR